MKDPESQNKNILQKERKVLKCRDPPIIGLKS
jgi:hypothetical protein